MLHHLHFGWIRCLQWLLDLEEGTLAIFLGSSDFQSLSQQEAIHPAKQHCVLSCTTVLLQEGSELTSYWEPNGFRIFTEG